MSESIARTFYIETLGCQMNVYDSEMLRGRLVSEGYARVPSPEKADVVLVNTCSVRRKAEAKAWTRLAQYARLKNDEGRPLIVLCGCVASRAAQGLGEGDSEVVDIVAGTGSYDSLVPAIEAALNGSKHVPTPRFLADSPTAIYRGGLCPGSVGLKAFVSISRGCDSHCTYCVVPSARGPHRSRPLPDIIDEVTRLSEQDTREVTLLGQNVNVYSHGESDFTDVLRAIESIPGIWRIRFTSPHPRDMDHGVVSAIRNTGKVCEHVHLPLQSGSDTVLGAMNRGYTSEHYRRLVQHLKSEIEGVAISTDLMVGFPGETDACFEESLRFVEEMEFDAAFTFKYSERPGTPAGRLPNQVPEETKARRLERLIELQSRMTDASNARLVGGEVQVLVEGRDQRHPEMLRGRTRTNKLVSFEGDLDLVGTLVTVCVRSTSRWTLRGHRVDRRPKGG